VDRLVGSALGTVAVVAGISCASARDSVAPSKATDGGARTIEVSSSTVEIPPVVGLNVRDAMVVCTWAELEIKIAVGDSARRPDLNELFATIESIPAKGPPPGKEVPRGSTVRVQLSKIPAPKTTIPPILQKTVGAAVYRCTTSGVEFRVWDKSLSRYRYPKLSELLYLVDSIRE